MNNNKLSILGSGWLGLPLAAELINQGYQVKLSTRQAEKVLAIEQVGAVPYLVDLDDSHGLSNGFFEDVELLICNITYKNKAGFSALIEHVSQFGIKHVLFVSSTSVYQNNNSLVSEDISAVNTENVLYQIERAFQASCDFKTTILRLSGLIGYRRHPGRFFAQGRAVSQPNAPVNLIHRDDCIGIISQIIKKNAWGHVFNGCCDTHPTKREFYSYARSLLGESPPIFSDIAQIQTKIVSNAKIKRVLGYGLIYPDLMRIPFNEIG
ncbi:MAG: nucleoside-diphosphate-sugar epimerase [Methylophagaceae bacterium]|jgi:nucleoside-diphosphate-sugar epimerase